MDGTTASALHADLAHALTPIWTQCITVKRVVQSELALWETRRVESSKEFFEQIDDQFRRFGVEPDARVALQQVESAFPQLDRIFERLVDMVQRRYNSVATWKPNERIVLRREWRSNRLFPDEP